MGNLYEKIKELCIGRRIKISEMCRDIGISASVLSDLKHGRKNALSFSTIQKIADYFEVSTDYFYNREGREEDAELTEYLEYLKSRPEMKMLFSTVKGASKEEIERVVRMIEAYRGDGNNG